MTEQEIRELIADEFESKTLGVTQQYLEIHSPVYINGKLQIDRIDTEKLPDLLVVYLPIQNEYFFFAVYIDPDKKEVLNIATESRNQVSLWVESEILSIKDIKQLTKLIPIHTFEKGDLKANGKSTYNFSRLEFTPNPEPDEVEDKLKKLLEYLETDRNGVIALTKNANAFVQIFMDFHKGNQLLGGANINVEYIAKLYELNLSVNFDFSAWGNPFKN